METQSPPKRGKYRTGIKEERKITTKYGEWKGWMEEKAMEKVGDGAAAGFHDGDHAECECMESHACKLLPFSMQSSPGRGNSSCVMHDPVCKNTKT